MFVEQKKAFFAEVEVGLWSLNENGLLVLPDHESSCEIRSKPGRCMQWERWVYQTRSSVAIVCGEVEDLYQLGIRHITVARRWLALVRSTKGTASAYLAICGTSPLAKSCVRFGSDIPLNR